jgi:TolC family type I secretion outer membrane protein
MVPLPFSRLSLVIVFFIGQLSIPQQVLALEDEVFSDEATLLGLSQAIRLALSENPMMSAVKSQLDVSQARVTQARSGLLPQLNFSENFTRTTSPTGVFSAKLNQGEFTQQDFNVDRLNNPNARNNFATGFSVTLPVFDSGQNWLGLSQAKLEREATNMGASRTRQQVIAETVISYARVLLARGNARVVEQALKTARAHLDLVKSRVETGLVVKSDLLRAEVRVAELEQERLQAQSQLEIARAALNATLGLEINSVFRLNTSLERGHKVEGSLLDWDSRALEHRADLAQVKYQELVGEKEIKKAKAAHLPSIHLLGNYEINTEDFRETKDNYTVGAIFRLNLYSGHNLQSRVLEARAKLSQMRALRQRLELAVSVEVKQAFLQAQSSWHRIGVAQGAVAQAEEGLRIVRNRYENGLYTIVNLLDAETAFQQARNNYLGALHDYMVSRVQLALAAGTLDEDFR